MLLSIKVFFSWNLDTALIVDGSKRIIKYKIPQDNLDVQAKVKLVYSLLLNVYMGGGKFSFNKVVISLMNELVEKRFGWVSWRNEKFAMIFYDVY